MKIKKIAIVAFVLGVIAVGVYFWFFSAPKEPVVIWRTARVEKGDITTIVSATGTVSALTTVQVGAQVNGTISKLLADFNSVVEKGDVVAILDTTFLVASRDDASANLEKARAQFKQYTREFDRAKKLFDARVNTQVDYEAALTNYELGKSNLRSAEAQLRRAKINLQYATIKAPISGTVISRNVDVGQTVISSFNAPTLFSIANDLTKMELQANIDEADIGQIRIDQLVSFSVDAYPSETFSGHVKQIRLQPVTVQNVVNYVVIIEVPNPELKLMPGMTANIEVTIDEQKDVFKVPVSALHFTPPAEYAQRPMGNTDGHKPNEMERVRIAGGDKTTEGILWILKSDSLQPLQVMTGISDGAFVAVDGLLTTGDVVVTGMNNHTDAATPTAQNPFMPKMPRTRTR
jgi:HlyD family secretion protein